MIRPNPSVVRGKPYSVPRAQAPTDLFLDGNEGAALPDGALDVLIRDAERVRRYPKAGPLEAALAERAGIEAGQVIVSAGGDDLIDRCCRVVLRPGRALVLPVPGFAMTRRYGEIAGAEVVEIPWESGAFPVEACLAVPDAGMIVVTSPNNPTGAVATAADVDRICAARPDAMVLVDAAYAEFADEDLTEAALQWDNALVIRTFSKAWGLAGLRVGYALGSLEVIGWLRAAGAPYPVSGPALALAEARLRDGVEDMRRFVARAREERAELERTLASLGASVTPSQGNFAFARLSDPLWLRDGMAGLGIAIRAFPGRPVLENAVRISVPGDAVQLDRLLRGLKACLAPEALLLDLDGVVADVSGSYREAIRATARTYGVRLTEEQVLAAKAAGDANNDWVLTQQMLAARGVEVSLAEVTATFEALVQGTDDEPGLWTKERLLVTREVLARMAQALPIAAVTGRPRLDAERFLETQGIADLFSAVICMEDGPAKPDPAPVLAALKALGVGCAWMVGDTPDDARAARSAGVIPLGVRTGGVEDVALFGAGCARVVDSLTDLAALVASVAADEEARCAG